MDLITDFYPLYEYIKKRHYLLSSTKLKIEQLNKYDNPKMFLELKPLEQILLISWIFNTLVPSKSINNNVDSYWIKHKFSDSLLGFYISNGQFKGAMILAGYRSIDMGQQNWHFNIKQASITNLNRTHANSYQIKNKLLEVNQ